jgi:hypothetical protein
MPSAAQTHRRPTRIVLVALVATVTALALVLPAAPAVAKHRGPTLRISFAAPKGRATASAANACRVNIVRHRFRIRSVTFTVNGRKIGVDRHAPFTCRWRAAGSKPRRYTLRAKATDVRGYRASAKMRVVVSAPPINAAAPAPSGAAIGVSAVLRGMDSGELNQTVARLRSVGVEYTREDFAWNRIETSPGNYDWSNYDNMVGGAAKQGLKIIAIADGAPAWATPSPTTPPASGSALAGYNEFVRQAILRYGSNGTFWATHPDIPKVPVTTWDVWNEPYFKYTWGEQTPDPAAYARMFKTVAVTGRATDPQAKFMLEADSGNGGYSWPQPPYLSAMFDAVPDLASYADYVSIHPYTGNDAPSDCTPYSQSQGVANDWKATRFQFCRVKDIRNILDDHGARNTRMWITEVGYTTAPQGSRGVSEAQQAQYVHDVFRLLRQWRLVDGLTWYCYKTDESNPSDDEAYYGLVHADGSAKPAWDAFVQEARQGL